MPPGDLAQWGGEERGAKQPDVFLFDHRQLPSHFYAYFVKP